MNEEEYIRPSAVAKRLGVTRGAVYKWIREGKLKSVRFGDNAVRIKRSDLEEFERRASSGQSGYNPDDILIPGLAAQPELAALA
jgi:excisionase family DNA binding protein